LEGEVMIVTATEIKNNFGRYIRLAAKEDIIITKNGEKIAKLISYDIYGNECGSSVINESGLAYNYDKKKVSYEEFLEIRDNSNERYEYIDGEIYLMSAPKVTHQKILSELHSVFYNWFKDKKCTPMIAPFDIKLKRSETQKNIVQPDLMVICDLEEELGEDDYYNGVPVFVVEIISDSTKSKDYVKKLDLYMSCGISEYWIVDPIVREVHVFVFKVREMSDKKTCFSNDQVKSGTFHGLEVDLKSIFL
jgi:prevent-host-death family protein